MTEINSNAYWDKRFIENWEANSGPSQSRFFARLAIQNLPTWLVTLLRRETLTFADWGCAQGDGTDEWATYLDAQRLTGIDFSSVAIEQATKRYPAIRFVAENWLLGDNTKRDKYDIVFSSNVIEHFHKPFDVLHVLCKKATKGVVLALPYREMDRNVEHFFTFMAENVPLGLPNNFRLVWSQVVDCRHISNTHWSGDQIVLVYANAKWIDKLGLSLNDCLIEHEDVISDRIQINSVLKERDGRLAAINLTHAERERELQDNLLTARNELLHSEQAWIEKAEQQEVHNAAERAELQLKLDELQQALLATERGKTEQLQSHAERERELQDNLLTVRNELLHSEQAWIQKAEQQEVHNAERAELQLKLDELQQVLLTTEQEKAENLQTHAEHERELQDNLLTVRNKLRQVEQAWLERSSQQESIYTTERVGLQAKLDELQQTLLATEREKTEQLQSHAERERELQDNLLTVRNELLQSEQAGIEKAEQQEVHYAAERAELQLKLDELQQALLATEREKTEQLQVYSEQLNSLKKTAHEWESTATALQLKIDSLLSSKFWRLSTPLRKFSGLPSEIGDAFKPKTETLTNAPFGSEVPPAPTHEMPINQLTITNSAEKAPNMNHQLIQHEITHIEDLLALYGEPFVCEAYRTLLGRHPDPEGLAYYLNKLRRGANKLDILIQLKKSKEAKSLINANIQGMNASIRRHRLSKLPLMGWIKSSRESMDNRLRVIENKLFEVNTEAYSFLMQRDLVIKTQEIIEKNIKIEEFNRLLAEKNSEIDYLRNNKQFDLTWEQFESKILQYRDNYKGIFIQEVRVDWNITLFQRPQHICAALGRLGYLVIYKTANWGNGDNISAVRQVAPNVWMTSLWEANNIEGGVHSVLSTDDLHRPEDILNIVRNGVIVYEYIDHIDPQISGEGEIIKHLLKLKDWAFGGGANYIVASASKLEIEAVNAAGRQKVILAQNGVDTRHYRNPIHLSTTLPENLISFRKKYSNIVGYFGAIAPWLWYEIISELVKIRPDLGFVFIGPDYYGGVEKLPKTENMLYLGTVDYKILPAYARQFDICFIPFAPGEIAHTTSPLKLFEYFALEKPVVVTTEMLECVAFKEVFSGDSAHSLSSALDKAIAIKSDSVFKAKLAQLADENDWDERARAMEPIFQCLKVKKDIHSKIKEIKADLCGLKKGLVSVVLPVYNQANLLEESISSVLTQTYRNFELIIVNDGSTDSVETILEQYVDHPKVRIFNQTNQKLPKALSNGFEFAGGEYWTWTSADNVMEPKMLEMLVAKLESEPLVGMVYADYFAIDDHGDMLKDPTWRSHNRDALTIGGIRLPRTTESLNSVQDNFIGPCFMYRGWIGRCLGDYDTQLGIEDYDYWMRINAFFQIKHIGSIDYLYKYRVHDNTLSAKAQEHQIYEKVYRLMDYEKERADFYNLPVYYIVDDVGSKWLVNHKVESKYIKNINLIDDSSEIENQLLIIGIDSISLARRIFSRRKLPVAVLFNNPNADYIKLAHLPTDQLLILAYDELSVVRSQLVTNCIIIDGTSDQSLNATIAFFKNKKFLNLTRKKEDFTKTLPKKFVSSIGFSVALQVDDFLQGGLENVVIDLATSLKELGVDVLLIILGREGDAAIKARESGINTASLGAHPSSIIYKNLLQENNIGLVNAHYSIYGASICSTLGIPFVQTIHNTYIWFKSDIINDYQLADSFTSAYICVSANVARYADIVLKLDARKMKVLHNGINIETIDVAHSRKNREILRREWGVDSNNAVFLNVASIVGVKSQLALIKAFSIVLKTIPKARLVLLGGIHDPDYYEQIATHIKIYNLEDNVIFAGYDKNVEKYYSAADVFVLPSFIEGWSLSLGEAVVNGLPCVITDVGSSYEFYDNNAVIIIDPPFSDITSLNGQNAWQIVSEQYPDFELRLSEGMLKAAKRTREEMNNNYRTKFNRDDVYKSYASFFISLVEKNSGFL